jgi:hypothetical protein
MRNKADIGSAGLAASDSLVADMLAKNPATLQVTKYFLDKGKSDQRRKLVLDFWQD